MSRAGSDTGAAKRRQSGDVVALLWIKECLLDFMANAVRDAIKYAVVELRAANDDRA